MQLSVGTAIRTYREAKGWNQEDLAKAADLDKNTVSRIELGGNATVDTLLRISRALGVDLEIRLHDIGSLPASDVQSAMSPPVIPASNTGAAPGEEQPTVPYPSFPASPVHVSLYGLVADLTEDQARILRRPLLELIEKIQRPPDKSKREGK